MSLPHFIKYAPNVARIGGHTGITILFWTFTNRRQVSLHFKYHEYRHVQQWFVGTLLGLALTVISAICGASLWVLALAPFSFPFVYFLSQIPDGYHGSWFERDAERYACIRTLNGE